MEKRTLDSDSDAETEASFGEDSPRLMDTKTNRIVPCYLVKNLVR